jgi:Ni2+-binding GTPase involved in maturation of urease and hydrogenase
MERDARARRGDRPTLFTNLLGREGIEAVVAWVTARVEDGPAPGR